MSSFDTTRREALIGASMAMASAISLLMQPRRAFALKPSSRTLASFVPTSIAAWRMSGESGLVLPTGEIGDPLYDEQVARVYSGKGLPDVMLLVAYGAAQSFAKRTHQPSRCYPSNGFKVFGLHDTSWPLYSKVSVPGRAFSATRQERQEQVGYWQRLGQQFPVSRMDERVALIQNALHGVVADGVLVRISVLTNYAARGQAIIRHFAAALIQGCDKDGRALLLGQLSGPATAPAA